MAEVANYDQQDYDYKTYWEDREYEDKAEIHAFTKLMKPFSGKRFIDIGGSFGRNLHLYADRYDEVVIFDYSLKTLQKYEKEILDQYPNAKIVAGNVYNMPFKPNSFDGALMVRVLHHLEEPKKYFTQLSKILGKGGRVFQEFANKVHIKARLKWILTGQFSQLDKKPYQQITRVDDEKEGATEESIFLNFHPAHIKELMEESGLIIEKKTGCSYLRSPKLKKLIPKGILMAKEKIMQATLGWSNLPPSVIYQGVKVEGQELRNRNFTEILACPTCSGKLEISNNNATCAKCNKSYVRHSTIWDLRA